MLFLLNTKLTANETLYRVHSFGFVTISKLRIIVTIGPVFSICIRFYYERHPIKDLSMTLWLFVPVR